MNSNSNANISCLKHDYLMSSLSFGLDFAEPTMEGSDVQPSQVDIVPLDGPNDRTTDESGKKIIPETATATREGGNSTFQKLYSVRNLPEILGRFFIRGGNS